MKNDKGFALPVSKQIILMALAFGIAAALVVFSGLLIPIYGETINADPRELFITLGSALAGPIGGIIIGFMGHTWSSDDNFQILSLILHVTGGLWMGFSYKKLAYEKMKYPAQLLGWVGLVFVYYFSTVHEVSPLASKTGRPAESRANVSRHI